MDSDDKTPQIEDRNIIQALAAYGKSFSATYGKSCLATYEEFFGRLW